MTRDRVNTWRCLICGKTGKSGTPGWSMHYARYHGDRAIR